MSFRKCLLLAASVLGLACMAVEPAAAEPASPAAPILFVHVNVAPMDREHVLRDQSVLVEDGLIKAVGPGLAAPAGVQVVDGHGTQWLSPGLADMHEHSDSRDDLKVFLAQGVTTVLNMGEAKNSYIAVTRPAVNRGEIPGPYVYAGFLVDGSPEYGHFTVTTPQEARSLVQLAKTNGYSFIKVYNNLSPACFYALLDEGKRLGLPVIGHGVTRVGLDHQLAAGQVMAAHAEEFLYTVFFKPGTDTQAAPDVSQIPAVIEGIKHSGAWVTADLNTYDTIARQWGKPAVVDDFLARPEIRYLAPADRLAWRGSSYATRKGSLEARAAFLAVFTKAMSDAGVPLITGTDSPAIPGLTPGYSLHQDLHALERAGLSRYQVLSAATRAPGEFISHTLAGQTPFGEVVPGDRADLVLTAGDPLDDLSQLDHPLGVMARGRWFDAAALKTLLDGVAEKYDQSAHHG